MGRLSDAAKCLAIGLLNYADDQGYFFAEPNLVRSALRPFDDNSTIVRRLLDELSRVGWIEVCESCLHGPIGRIVNFLKHQRIDKPNPKTIKDYWDSTTIRRLIDDQSRLIGKERKGTGNGNTPNPSDEFLEFWRIYPRKQSMKPAWAAWQKIAQPIPLKEIMEAVELQNRKVWKHSEKKHIPLAASWLNAERWDDEI